MILRLCCFRAFALVCSMVLGQSGAISRAQLSMFNGAPPPPAAEQLAAEPARMLRITSPDTAQTFTDSTTTRHLLRWDERAQALRVVMVFVNTASQGNGTNRVEEQFTFRVPGVSLDPATGVFSVRGPRGNAIPVAKRIRGGGGLRTQNAVEPTVGTRIFVSIVEGQVKVTLTADPAGSSATDRASTHWVIDSLVSAI